MHFLLHRRAREFQFFQLNMSFSLHPRGRDDRSDRITLDRRFFSVCFAESGAFCLFLMSPAICCNLAQMCAEIQETVPPICLTELGNHLFDWQIS